MNTELLVALASYGKRYRDTYLKEKDPTSLSSSPRQAIDFFLSRACYQGRLDIVSERVYRASIDVFNNLLPELSFARTYQGLQSQDWTPVRERLAQVIGKGKVGKARDIDMVVSALRFLGSLPELNIVNYSLRHIKAGTIIAHYQELQGAQSSRGIVQVGPKIAAFYLRDLVAVFALDHLVTPEAAFCLQPIDVWVKKVAAHLGLPVQGTQDDDLQHLIADACAANGVSPLMFNQGAWFVGYHSFDIALELLGKGAAASGSAA